MTKFWYAWAALKANYLIFRINNCIDLKVPWIPPPEAYLRVSFWVNLKPRYCSTARTFSSRVWHQRISNICIRKWRIFVFKLWRQCPLHHCTLGLDRDSQHTPNSQLAVHQQMRQPPQRSTYLQAQNYLPTLKHVYVYLPRNDFLIFLNFLVR